MTGMTQNYKDHVKFHTVLITYKLYFPLSYIMVRKSIDEDTVYNLSINNYH